MPAPVLIAPANNEVIDRNAQYLFRWDADQQSAFEFRVREGTSAWISTGQIISANRYRERNPPQAGTVGVREWQVRVWDDLGVVSEWSTSFFFDAQDRPAGATITNPVAGDTVGTNPAFVTFSYPSLSGWQIRTVKDVAGVADPTTVYFDTGARTDTATRTVSVNFPVDARYEHIQVRVLVNGLWSEWSAGTRIYVSGFLPNKPLVQVTPDPAAGTIHVRITNPPDDPSFTQAVHNEVLRLELDENRAGIAATETRLAVEWPLNSTFVDYKVVKGKGYAYRAVAIGDNGKLHPSEYVK